MIKDAAGRRHIAAAAAAADLHAAEDDKRHRLLREIILPFFVRMRFPPGSPARRPSVARPRTTMGASPPPGGVRFSAVPRAWRGQSGPGDGGKDSVSPLPLPVLHPDWTRQLSVF